uniref:Uncharacterized protein n=1 Tax=uncultured marine virus TaxID=186617 RepID=A0A0F7L415_9VIRU|nr:hypothetical protein [uncultured marine virus]
MAERINDSTDEPTFNTYRKIIGRHKAGLVSPKHLEAIFSDLLNRLAIHHKIDPDYPMWVEALGPKQPPRMTYQERMDAALALEAGLAAGIRQDHINEEEGNA